MARDLSWTSSTARQNHMAPLLAVVILIVVANAAVALWLSGKASTASATPARSEALIGEGAEQAERAASALAESADAAASRPSRLTVEDPEGLLADEAQSCSAELDSWLTNQQFTKRTLVKVTGKTGVEDAYWQLRFEVTGVEDDVLGNFGDGGWTFSWAGVVEEGEAREREAREKAEQEERERAEAAARAEAEWYESEREAQQEAADDDVTYTYQESSSPYETYEEEVVAEAYVPVTDAGWLSGYVTSGCASGLASALVSWADGVAGLRNADAAYLVASTVSGTDPCAFTVVVPSGMVDANLDWVDVSVRCTYSGGSWSFSL